MAGISRTFTFTDYKLSGNQVESEFQNIINAWNNHNKGFAPWDSPSLVGQMSIIYPGRFYFSSLDTLKHTLIGYILNQFQIATDSSDGLVVSGNMTVTKSFNPSYGGGNGVFFMGNAQVDPSTNPANGGILYVSGGALKYRGSSGSVTTVAPA